MQTRKRISFFLLPLLLLVLLDAITGISAANFPSPGSYIAQSSTTGTTNYAGAGGGSITRQQSAAQPSPLPLISDVLNQNSNNAQWLITCPDTPPNPYVASDFFTTSPQAFITGDRCLTDANPLVTRFTEQVLVTWSPTSPAQAGIPSFAISDVAVGSIDNLAYSGMTETDGRGNYNLSNGYDSASYIFGQVPPSPQQGIWSWHAKYADLSKIDFSAFEAGDTLPLSMVFPNTETVCLKTCPTSVAGTGTGTGTGTGMNAASPASPSASQFQSNTISNSMNAGTVAAFSEPSQSRTRTLQFDSCAGQYNSCYYGCPNNPSDPSYTSCHAACSAGLATCEDQLNNGGGGSTGGGSTGGGNTGAGNTGGGSTGSGTTTCCDSVTYQWTCEDDYVYNVQTAITSFGNSEIPIPKQAAASPPQRDYLSLNGFPYTPYTPRDLGYMCEAEMIAGHEDSVSCMISHAGNVYYIKDSDGDPIYGSLVLPNGKEYPHLYVYTTDASAYAGDYLVAYRQSCFLGICTYGAGVVPISSGGADAQQYDSAGALPYLLYNISMPASSSLANSKQEDLNLSFDIYSPENFLTASLDPFSLHTDSGLFAAYSTDGQIVKLGVFSSDASPLSDGSIDNLLNPIERILSSLTLAQVSTITGTLKTEMQTLGNYMYGAIPEPTFIAASPDDHIYVINQSSSCGGGFLFWCWSTNPYYMYVMRFIPKGYFNLSNEQPNMVGNADSKAAWDSQWTDKTGYWANSLAEQSAGLYITDIYRMDKLGSGFWSGYWYCAPQGNGCTGSFYPLAITTDYSGDIFLLGGHTLDNNAGKSWKGFELAEQITGAGGGNYINDLVATSSLNDFIPSDEFAVSAGGQYLYLANRSYGCAYRGYGCGADSVHAGMAKGEILVYKTPPTSTAFVYSGYIPLSYNAPDYNLNIAAYMANGGPFGSALIASAYAGAPPTIDMPYNHRPIAINEYKGFLYVLDNWTFDITTAGGTDLHSSILMLRVFSSNGIEVPIDGASINTEIPVSGSQEDLSLGTGTMPTGGWAPYGWPISVNITLPGPVVNNLQKYNYISYCVAGCTYTPTTPGFSTHYEPIGPAISFYGDVGPSTADLGLSTDFNGTSYLIAKAYPYEKVGSDQTNRGSFEAWATWPNMNDPMYTELLAFKLNLINYTRVSAGADSPYACYISADSHDGTPFQTPCAYDPSVASTLDSMYAPLLGVPSSFDYVESEGAPQQYYTLSNLISSLNPSTAAQSSGGGSSGSSTASGGVSCFDNTVNPPQPTTDTAQCSATGDIPSCQGSGASCPICTSGQLTCSDSLAPTCTTGTGQLSCSDGSTPHCTDGGSVVTGSLTPECVYGSGSTLPIGSGIGDQDSSASVTCTNKQGLNPSPTPTCQQVSAFSGMASNPIASAVPTTYINSIIQGYLLVPYHYTYTMTQSWTPGAVIGPTGTYPPGTTCSPYPSWPAPVTSPPQTVYTMAQANLQSSDHLMDYIQSGTTYLNQFPFGDNYYIANLSNEGFLPMSPNSIDYNIYTNRWFGEMFVNQTVAPALAMPPYALAKALVVNAVTADNYAKERFVQTAPDISGGSQTYEGYYAQDMITLTNTNTGQAAGCSATLTSCLDACPSDGTLAACELICQNAYTGCLYTPNPTYGANCGSSCPSNYYYDSDPGSLFAGSSSLSFSNSMETQMLPIFQMFDKTAYLDSLALSIEPNPPLGYNRLVYTLVDAFNNIITVPMDMDLANMASMTESASTVADPTNANQVTVTVTGTLQYPSPTGMQPLAGADVFIYYNTNLNYYNPTSSPSDIDPVQYFTSALQCAFATGSSSCQLANPLSSSTQPGTMGMPTTSGPYESRVVTYAPQFNAIAQCDPPATSLLAALPEFNQCNIYGRYGLSAVDTDTKPTLYCQPVYDNGNGIFTSQLGLTNVVTTDADGNFAAQFTACGSGTESVAAEYYGSPAPEPVSVKQPSLQYSANSLPAVQLQVSSDVLNYEYSPASQAVTILIGSNILSFGGMGIGAMLAFASILSVLFVRCLMSAKKK